MASAPLLALFLALQLAGLASATPAQLDDTLAQRLLACSACHGKEGRAGPDGYRPRIAGKPAGYLWQQLRNFGDGRRHYGPMVGLVDPLSDAYLREIAEYFAALELPYAPPVPSREAPALLERGRQLALQGDPARGLPACAACHGAALTGVLPATPGLLGLPRDYLGAQLGAWLTGQRHAAAPDCMADIARRLAGSDLSAVSAWLSSQPVPAAARPAPGPVVTSPLRCGSVDERAPVAAPPAPLSATVARGEAVARAGNCMACHTARGGAPGAGGRAIGTPFGTVYSANLTPDVDSGLGRGTAEQLWRALHEGIGFDGRRLVPACPYTEFTRIRRDDSDALFAWLRTLPPVPQARPAHALRWPFGSATALWAWRTLFFTAGEWRPDPRRSAEWNRGAYLVNGPGHCSACHGGRNPLGASAGSGFGGGLMPARDWYAPSLTRADEAGVADWPLPDIVALLRDGHSPRGVASGPMAEVVLRSTQHLPAADLRAIAVYLQSLPAEAARPRAALLQGSEATTQAARVAAGRALYADHCAACHGGSGEGGVTRDRGELVVPALAGNRMVTMAPPANLVRAIALGGFGPATAGRPRPFGMPPFAHLLGDEQIAAIATFLRASWGAAAAPVSAEAVQRWRGGGGE